MPKPPRTGARAVLASGIALGAVMLAGMAARRSHMLAANFEVYRVAAEAALAGEDFYAVAPDRFPDFYYLYPPISIVPFLPFAGVGLWTGFAVHTVLELAVGLALAVVIVRWIERYRSLERLDRALIAAFVVGSIHVVPSLVYGQVNLRMALLVGVGLFSLERAGRDGSTTRSDVAAGIALAVAALLKVFPAAIGVWLLRSRTWRALASAIVTGLGGLALGVAAFGPARTRTFVFDALLPRTDAEAFVGGLDPAATYVTIRRPISVLLPGLDPRLMTPLAALLLAIPLGYVYTRLETPVDRLLAAHATVLSVFVFFPSYPLYYVLCFGTLVPTLYLVADRPTRRLLVAGALSANVVLGGRTLQSIADVAPPAIGDPLLAVGIPLVTVSTPVLAGCLLMLAGCVRHRYRRGRGVADRAAEPGPSADPTSTE